MYKQVTALLYEGDIVCMPLCMKVSGITRQCQNSKGKYCGAKKQYDIKITSVFPSTNFSRSYNTLTTAQSDLDCDSQQPETEVTLSELD